MADVTLKNIYKVYPNGTKAVNDFSMNIEDKEFVVFVGPSGCGKSTTLRMIAGLEEISAGQLFIDGRVVNDVDCKERDTAMVFQNYALYPHMTVFDNIAFPLKMSANDDLKMQIKKRLSMAFSRTAGKEEKKAQSERVKEEFKLRRTAKKRNAQKVLAVAEILGLSDYLKKKPGAMSGGQRQRVALGRAIVREPKVFLLDEPLSNLDAKLRTQMRAEISALHSRLQTTFIYVTHDQTEAMTMGDRIVVMKDGFVQQIDTPINLYKYPDNKFVAGFIGTPPMNFFAAQISEMGERAKIRFGEDLSKELIVDSSELILLERAYAHGKKMILGVRPEEFELNEDGIEATITQIELLGSETLLYLRFEDISDAFIVKLAGLLSYRVGDKIRVLPKKGSLHFFDAETEESVCKRVPEFCEFDVVASEGKLCVMGAELTLPKALEELSGEYVMRAPIFGVSAGGDIPVQAELIDSVKEGDLYILRAGGGVAFALASELPKSISIDLKSADFYRGDELVKAKFDPVNELEGVFKKVSPSKEQKRAGFKFALEFEFEGKSVPCPDELAKRLIGVSDRKVFGVPLTLRVERFIEGDDIEAECEEEIDFGEEKFVRCKYLDKTLTIPASLCKDQKASLGIDMTSVSVYDSKLNIKLA